MKNSCDLISELIAGLPLWAHRRLAEKGVITWKMDKEQVIKKKLGEFTCSTAGPYLIYRVPRTEDEKVIFIIRLVS